MGQIDKADGVGCSDLGTGQNPREGLQTVMADSLPTDTDSADLGWDSSIYISNQFPDAAASTAPRTTIVLQGPQPHCRNRLHPLCAQPCLTLCSPRTEPARLLCPWNSPARTLERVVIS